MPYQSEYTKLRYVAFLDVLGFSNIVNSGSAENVYYTLENLLDQEWVESLTPKLKTHIFSDSIIIFSEDDSFESAEQIIQFCGALHGNAFACGTLIKGAISFGLFTADHTKNIYFGKPLIDAYNLELEIHASTILLHHSFELRIQSFTDLNTYHKTIETPMKGYSTQHANVTLGVLDTEDVIEGNRILFSFFYLSASGSHRKYIDNTKLVIDRLRDYVKPSSENE